MARLGRSVPDHRACVALIDAALAMRLFYNLSIARNMEFGAICHEDLSVFALSLVTIVSVLHVLMVSIE